MALTVVLADDHVIVRNGIKALLESEQDIRVVGEASDGRQALEVVRKLRPDLVVMDIRMPVMNGIEATRQLVGSSSSTKSLILSMHDNQEYVLQSIECGAAGYLLKDTEKEEFIKALKEIAAGGRYFSSPVAGILADNYLNSVQRIRQAAERKKGLVELSRKEQQILEHVALGLSNKDIAEKLDKSVRTVETQRFKLMKKLGVKNAVELVNVAKENQLIDDSYFLK